MTRPGRQEEKVFLFRYEMTLAEMFFDCTVARLLMGQEHPMNRGSRLDCPKVSFPVSMLRHLMFSVHAFVQQWYTSTMNLIGTWLTDRMDLQLHLYQLKILIRIVKVSCSL